mmetsp:Transcript_23853/g.52595  ORF Transcript_23853/g.52595 Transcript_23853/m.52595 type:complete len:207 (+) Transcript_23853:682-1302(+)
MRILSSNPARKVPCVPTAFLISPRIPLTVWSLAWTHLLTSRSEENIPEIKAVFLKICLGSPTNLSFLTMRNWVDASSTKPVAAIRNPATPGAQLRTHNMPVCGCTSGAQAVIMQCLCSGEYFNIRTCPLRSSVQNMGMDWNRRHPAENSNASFVFSSFLCHLCFFTRIWSIPSLASPAKHPPNTMGLAIFSCSTLAAGTLSKVTRT